MSGHAEDTIVQVPFVGLGLQGGLRGPGAAQRSGRAQACQDQRQNAMFFDQTKLFIFLVTESCSAPVLGPLGLWPLAITVVINPMMLLFIPIGARFLLLKNHQTFLNYLCILVYMRTGIL